MRKNSDVDRSGCEQRVNRKHVSMHRSLFSLFELKWWHATVCCVVEFVLQHLLWIDFLCPIYEYTNSPACTTLCTRFAMY